MYKSVFFRSSPASMDEEMIDLNEELGKQHQLHEDGLVLLTKSPEKPEIYHKDRKNYFCNTPKNQETLRVKFIGNMLKNLSYYNNLEPYLDDFYERREKLLYANKDPNEIRLFLQKKLSKKVLRQSSLLSRLPHLLQPSSSESPDLSREIKLDLSTASLRLRPSISSNREEKFLSIAKALEEDRSLIAHMEAVNFVEKRNEDELITEKHLYENFKQQMQDNFGFLGEQALGGVVDDLATLVHVRQHVQALKVAAVKLPVELCWDYAVMGEKEFFNRNKGNEWFQEKDVTVPLRLEDITKKMVNLAKELGIHDDISTDNGALLLFNIETFFHKSFVEQAKFLDFSQFKYGSSSADFRIIQSQTPLDSSLEHLIFEPDPDPKAKSQKQRLWGFEDSLVNSWTNCLLINDENEAVFFVEKKSREYYEQHRKELYLPEIYFEFFKAWLKLSIINSRKALINIFSYVNYLQHFERNLRIVAQGQVPGTGPNPHFDDSDCLRLIDHKDEKSLVYDKSLELFFLELEDIKHLASFGVHFTQKPIKVDPGSEEIQQPSFDNINRQELIDELLGLHCRYLREKTKILVKLSEIMCLATDFPHFRDFARFSLGILRARPLFPLFKDELFRVYAAELSNSGALLDLIKAILDHQKKLERKLWKARQFDSVIYQVLREQPKPGKVLLFANETIKTLLKLSEGLSLLTELFHLRPCELEKSRLTGVFLRKMGDFWSDYTAKPSLRSELWGELSDLMGDSLENDEILDKFKVFNEFTDFLRRGALESKTDSPKLKKSLQSNSLSIKDKLILGLNLLEFLRTREKLRRSLFGLAFSLKVFRKQQLVFLRDPVRIENVVGVNNMGNLLKGLVSLEALKCSIDITSLKNWVLYIINQKKMDEPFLLLQYLFSIESLLRQYTVANTLYYDRISLEFPEENDRNRKLQETEGIFLDIFEKKKSVAFRVLQFKRISVFMGSGDPNPTASSASNKLLNKNTAYNPFFTKGYKSQAAQTINDFTSLLNKETYHEILKLNTINIRNKLEALNQRLPSKLKIFKVQPLKPLKPLQVIPQRLSIKIQEKSKGQPQEKESCYEFPKSLLNLDILPSIEDLSKFKSEDTTTLSSSGRKESITTEHARDEKFSATMKRRSSVLTTPITQMEVFQKTGRKSPLKSKEFTYLQSSPVYSLMNILFHLLNIVSFELFRRLAENSPKDLLLYLEGVMDESEFAKKSKGNDTQEDFKRTIVRISGKLNLLRDDFDNIERNIAIIHSKFVEKSINTSSFPQEVLKYLKTLHKRQYNTILMALLVDFDHVASRAILERFCFNKLSVTLPSSLIKKPVHLGNSVFKEKSPKMVMLEEVFLRENIRPGFSGELMVFFERNNFTIFSLLDQILLESEIPVKKRLVSRYSEIIRILEVRRPEGVQGMEAEKLAKKELQINIKAKVFKLMAERVNDEEDINKKIGFLERLLEKEQKVRLLIDPERNRPLELSREVQEAEIIRKRLDFLSNELEKGFIRESLRFYQLRSQILAKFINEKNYTLVLQEEKKLEANKPKVNQLLGAFKDKFLASSSQINIFKVGKGFVIPIKRLKEDISLLNQSFLDYLSKSFDFFLVSNHETTRVLAFSKLTQAVSLSNMEAKRRFLGKSFSEIVESKIAKRSSDLLFQLDHLYKALNYMKDEEALREQEIKKITRNEFSERIVDKKNDINIMHSRFQDYKTGMTYDLTKYIEEAKVEAEKMIQKRNAFRPSFLTRFTEIFKIKNEEGAENLEKGMEEIPKNYNDKKKLFKTFLQLRVFFILRHQVLKQKFFKDLEEKNQKFISSEVLWNKIKDLEKNEARIKEFLINSEKEIAVLEHQNLLLKKDVRNITLEKVQLYKANNLQRGQILELEENFAVLKRKKFIDNPDTEGMVKATTRPMSSVANKLLRQQTEMFALNNEEDAVDNSSHVLSQKKSPIIRAESAKRFGISDFGLKTPISTGISTKKKPKKQQTSTQKTKQWGYESGLFVRKSFKITTGSMSNLKFYAKEETKESEDPRKKL